MKSRYGKALNDPRWQRKRLEIMNRDGFKCCDCGNDEIELHVHYLIYSDYPWNTPDKDLKTLCKVCHFFKHFKFDFTTLKESIRVKYLGTELIK